MSAAAESDMLMFTQQQQQQQQQQYMEPFGSFFQDIVAGGCYNSNSSELEELEKNLFSDSEFDSIAAANLIAELEGDDILSALPCSNSGFLELAQKPIEEPQQQDYARDASASPFRKPGCLNLGATRSSKWGFSGAPLSPTSPSVSRNASFSGATVAADELNSLSLDQYAAAAAAAQIISSSNAAGSSANKRTSSSPLASPKKQAHKELEAHVDSKEGILGGVYGDPPSAMGLVFGNSDGGRRPFLMQRSMSSHALGQLRGPLSGARSASAAQQPSALDSAMQGLACSSSIAPSLSQLLDVNAEKIGGGAASGVNLSDAKGSSSGFSSIRRVCSTGDIQRMNSLQPDCQDDGQGFKIGRYSLAERKERISRYRQKRSERNFNKKIKYACRKTLADSRPRVRGRFAKNEDVPDSTCSVQRQSSRRLKADGEYDEEVLEEDESFLIDRQSSGELSDYWGMPLDGR